MGIQGEATWVEAWELDCCGGKTGSLRVLLLHLRQTLLKDIESDGDFVLIDG